MALTKEQLAIRRTGVGASEVAEVVELHPYRGPIDVWLRKTGRALEEETSDAGAVGHMLEAFALALYTRRTGIKVQRQKVTLRHPVHEHMLASPDALGRTEDLGAEAKIVGWRMAHHWADDSVPDYVRLQAVQNMAVTGRSRWDVVALIGGTDLRVFTITRDPDMEALLAESIELFWADHVVRDVPPPVRDPEERRRYLRTRYPGSEATRTRLVNDPVVAAAADRLRELDEAAADIERQKRELTDGLCELVGDDYGIEGGWGKFLWYPTRGAPAWKAIAEELAGGAVSTDIIERHRGEPSRTPRLYEPKKTFITTRKRRTT